MKNESSLESNSLLKLFDVMQDELYRSTARSEESEFARLRLSARARKRASIVKPELAAKTIDAFIASNNLVADVVVRLDQEIIDNAKYFLTIVLERYTKSFDPDSLQETLVTDFLWDNWRFGPGSSNGVKGTHTAEKITQLMTCTAPCESFVRHLRFDNTYFRLYDESCGWSGVSLVNGSRLTTVPKNEDTERTIAIEPLGNMAMQLAAGRYLENTLRYIGLDISTQQEKNKLLSQRGSIDGSIATIDLKSASDMISPMLVRLLMPPEWFRLLMRIRSPSTKLPDGREIQLNMMSTMGNGFTFPLMTLLLVSLIYGMRCQSGGPNLRVDWTNTAVFGDDIIVPVHEYQKMTEILEGAGLIVNHDKSFHQGYFRESCGGDYYKGVNVTPFYIRSIRTDPEIYVVINQVLLWCAQNKIWLTKTLAFLIKQLRGSVFIVPEWANSNQGILSATCSRRYKYLSVTPFRRKLRRDHPFEMMLAVGGYIEESDSDHLFTPRADKQKVKIRAARLPRGYLDGHDPITRTRSVSWQISTMVDLLR